MRDWALLAAAIAAEVIATSSLKASEGFTRPGPTAVVLAGYATAFYLLSLALRTISVGVAYAVWSGMGVVLVTVVAFLVYGQKIDGPGIAGIALILAGIAVLNLFSRTAAH